MTHQQICRVIPRQICCGACCRWAVAGSLPVAMPAVRPVCPAPAVCLRPSASSCGRGLLHHSAGDKIITSRLWPCRGGHAGMPNVPPHSVERHVWLCSPARYARRFPAFGSMLWQGVFPWHGLSGKSITPMGCGPWPWLVACCRTVARRCMPSVTCFSPLPSLLAVRPHRRAVPSGISPCQSLWP